MKDSAAPFCQCYGARSPMFFGGGCSCGEVSDQMEFGWESAHPSGSSVVVSEDGRQVTFHPVHSAGTAVARADAPLRPDRHYYWEVKMLTEDYGTDIMVGLGTDKVNVTECQYKFASVLGEDGESYGMSFRGHVMHAGALALQGAGFCRGSLVGVRVDMWRGTLEFYVNRKSQGVLFTELRRHRGPLYPMLCSTPAQSVLRLTHASSRPASLLVDAARSLAGTLRRGAPLPIPPGLWDLLRGHFWMTLPFDDCLIDEENQTEEHTRVSDAPESPVSDAPQWSRFNRYYTDSVGSQFRLVVRH